MYVWSFVDLVVSFLGLHWTNDLLGAMRQVCYCLLSFLMLFIIISFFIFMFCSLVGVEARRLIFGGYS